MIQPALIVPLRKARDPALVGGKAVNLARMIRAGLPVPDGFVVTTAAFRQVSGTIVPAALATQIQEAYDRMGRPQVAARSSATAEDMAQASMAGQYETYLNLGTAQQVIEAVVKCCQSVRSPRVQAYLQEHGITPESVAMAVVVQRLVHADVAGVLFTANPQTGSMMEMLIEASWGLGESVVSGQVQPDCIRVSFDECEVLGYHVADKQVHLMPGRRDMEPVPEAQRNKACLGFGQIRELWRLGRAAAQYFDGPQDIEWAVACGQVFMLQARPITTLAEVGASQRVMTEARHRLRGHLDQGRGPWVRHNLGETLPHPTPLTWAVVRRFMSGEGGFGRMYRMLGFEPSPAVCKEGFLELIAGRVYMDCARMPEMFSEGYPFAYDVDLLRTNPDAAQQPPTVPRGGYRQLAAAGRLGAKVTAKLHEMAVDLDRRFDAEFVPQVEAWCGEQAALDCTQLQDAALIDLWHAQQAKVMDEFGAMAFLPSMVEAMATAELRAFLDEHSWDREPDELLHGLSIGPVLDRTIAANTELQEVARGLRPLKAWLAAYGHRAPGEFELATPRWSERPEDLRRMAEPLKAGEDLGSGHHLRYRQSQQCLEALKANWPADLGGALEERVALVRRYGRFREDGKYHWMRAYAVLRQTALEFGRRLGLGERVFFLMPDEVLSALRSGFVPEDRIERRSLCHRVEDRVHLPHVIAGEDVESLGLSSTPVQGGSLWNAHPVSCGVNAGPARVVLSPEKAGDIGSGYILVCPSTDPSWTPLFARAAGLILERGGVLSHGAVVAREMGLPAVVLDGATTLFQDGEILTVDSNRGVVTRGSGPATVDPDDVPITRDQVPPKPSEREARANRKGLTAAAFWGGVLAATFILPDAWLRGPVFGLLDAVLWPLVPRVGMVWLVAIVAAVFGLVLIVGQRILTDNSRLWEAKRRGAQLRKLAASLPKDGPRRKAAEQWASPVSGRMLKAAMVPLAFVLGPMIWVFLWLPERVDPATWNADPGVTVTVVAEVDGDFQRPVTIDVPVSLTLEQTTAASQVVPPIRQDLEQLRMEWQQTGDANSLPRELRMLADYTRQAMLANLDAYLQAGVPPQTLSWRIGVPESADGHFPVRLTAEGEGPVEFPLVFGRSRPPAPELIHGETGLVRGLKVVYPRPLQRRVFWAPLALVGGPAWDLGWLTVYVLSYIAVMVAAKRLLRVP